MKLLYDQNLPPRLVATLAPQFPDSRHVTEVGLDRADDSDVWMFAQRQGFTIVSKDADFMQMSFLRGAPPKIVWVRRGNCSTGELEELLRSSADTIQEFAASEDLTILVLR